MTWIIVKIANLFLKDAELSIKCIYFYPLNGVIRICKLKLSLWQFFMNRYCTQDYLFEVYDLSIVFHVWKGIDKCLTIQTKGVEVFVYGNEEKYKQVV